MLTILATTALALGGAQEETRAPADEVVKQLATATAEMARAESYSFTSTSKTTRPEDGDAGAEEGRDAGQPVTTRGAFAKGMPLHLVSGETVAYKNGDVLVHRTAEGQWEEVDRRSLWRGGRGGGRRGGEGGQERGGGSSGQGGGNSSLMSFLRLTPPHRMLADFQEKQATLAHTREGERDVFAGKLTEAAAQELGGGFGRRGGGRGGRGGGGQGGVQGGGQGGGGIGGQMTVEGTYRVELQAGRVVGASFVIERSGEFGGRSFDMTTETSFAFQKVGETELEVPNEVLLLVGS